MPAATPAAKDKRRQLSMFVPAAEGLQLESVRRELDPVQAALIPAHVTLCRDAEIDQFSIAEIEARISNAAVQPIRLRFGRPVIFEGHGVLLPCVAGEPAFHELRTHVLGTTAIRRHEPHITLAHPRNPPASKCGLAGGMGYAENHSFTFATIVFIEQTGAAPWQVLREFSLRSR